MTELKKINGNMGVVIKKATEVGMTLRKHMGEQKFETDPNPLKTFRDRIDERAYERGVKETTEKLSAEWEEKYNELKKKKGADVDLSQFVKKDIPFNAIKEIAAEFGFEVDSKKFKESLRQLVYIGMELAAGKEVEDLEDAELEEDEVEEEEVAAPVKSVKKVVQEDIMDEDTADEPEEKDSGEWDGLGEDDDVSPETAKLLKIFESEMEEAPPRVVPMKSKVPSAKAFLDAFDMED